MSKDVFVSFSSHGRGVFASQMISLGEKILTFSGPLMSFQQAVALNEKERDYTLQLGRGLYIYPQEPGRFVNHSCEANCGIREGTNLVSLSDIVAGEELCFDYSSTMDEDSWTMFCSCGSSSCRGEIKDFKYLSLDLQRKYLSLGIVQAYILERILPTFFKRVL